MKSILFTFDYELFLGTTRSTSGNIDECLIDPTNRILEIFKKYSIEKAIFFVDTLYIEKLEKIANQYENAKIDLDKLYSQLERIIELNHYVFPHIHAHWIDAKYISEINQWIFPDLSKFKFDQLNENEKKNVFQKSIKVIQTIYKDRIPFYEMGYRAGGWCIQPFNAFKKYFTAYNIIYDFSVIRDSKEEKYPWNYDFTNTPNDFFYSFSNCVNTKDTNGEFIEFPISVIKTNYFYRALIRIFGIFQNYCNKEPKLPNYQDITTLNNRLETIKAKIKNNNNPVPFAIERLNFVSYLLYSKYIKKNKASQFISHPKLIKNHHLKLLEKLIVKNKIYSYETDFKKILNGQS